MKQFEILQVGQGRVARSDPVPFYRWLEVRLCLVVLNLRRDPVKDNHWQIRWLSPSKPNS